MYVSKVILPNNAPVKEATGQLMKRKALAIASACLAAIEAIYKVSSLLFILT